MKKQMYTIAVAAALLSTIMAFLYIADSLVYGTSDDDDDNDENSDENDPCYNAGYDAGRSGTFNQTQQSNCGSTGQAYYEGFISGCIAFGGGDYSACDAKTK
jgi:hypothetical protein